MFPYFLSIKHMYINVIYIVIIDTSALDQQFIYINQLIVILIFFKLLASRED